jgi:hypothetical protein
MDGTDQHLLREEGSSQSAKLFSLSAGFKSNVEVRDCGSRSSKFSIAYRLEIGDPSMVSATTASHQT